jgi:4,5:9,10-diseco-3-hydroxy-5,9,17-trioxoandrosta-1(10),2-diene-4-oate hydrolase
LTTTLTEAATSKFANAGNVRIHYNEVGAGPVMICIHGGGPGANSWSTFTSNVDEFARDHRVLFVDLPQFGKSAKIALEGPQLTTLAAIMNDFMTELKIDTAAFVGNSFGGQVAIKLAIDFPHRVSHLVVLGSAPVIHSIFAPMPVEGVKLIGAYYREGGPSLEKMRAILSTLLFDQSRLTDAMVRERYEASIDPEILELKKGPPPQRQDLTSEFGRVAAPTLVVWGMDDRAGALDVGLLMVRAFQNAQMHIFSKCGHWAQVEHAREFNDLVLAFIKPRGPNGS